MLDLPTGITTCLFDLDGVLTQTAEVHARAWKELFDGYLRKRAQQRGEAFEEFELTRDYDRYVDGKPRLEGVRSFLASRGIEEPDERVQALGTRKNELVLRLIHDHGVEAYEGSVRFVEAARDQGLRCAVVSSSTNCQDVLEAAGIDGLLEARVDGLVAERDGLAGKPAPDTFLAAARLLGAEPAEATVFEDALAGVEAGRAGAFGWVVGVDRSGQADELRRHGADVVVQDLAELLERR
jgi:beta-phosphoglucomutase family hydrolase